MTQLLPSCGLALVMLMPELATFALFLVVAVCVIADAVSTCSRLLRTANQESAPVTVAA